MPEPESEAFPPQYLSREIEAHWCSRWENEKAYHAAKPAKGKKPFSMVIPPPNVTGILHMGHALNDTIQDIIARFQRMNGRPTLWMPGTDHAGIATQNVVEKNLRSRGLSPRDLGREKFLEEVWRWKEKYGGTIVNQLKRLGCSCDWPRLRFTLDEGLSEAVREVFIRLYDKGLVYRHHYIINWCPRCQTALSDEEVNHREIQGHFYHIRYAIKDSAESVVIATTRPETLLGDTAIGFNPEDSRYKGLKGRTAVLPLLLRELAIITDAQIDPAFGTGALKITPGHDPVDFELGKKHKLPSINILNTDGTLNAHAGPYQGLDRFEARKRVLADLTQNGLLVKTEAHTHSVGHCYRCETVIEPYCSDQWFVKMKPLAQPAIQAVRSGRIRFHPARWSKVYLDWMLNIRDWCISRQIWWGHRIPVYYAPDGRHAAARNPEEARKKLKLGPGDSITQDPDVLDTWFSSWLWPFSTMGWPQATADLKHYYPTQTLVTGYEIIFFWVARMIMAGFEFTGKAPFSDIYIHGIVRDATGAKMSKSKGNIIDPLEMIDEFGTDALRFSIISITSEGQDVYASKERFEVGRNFANKIWNASRFIFLNQKRIVKSPRIRMASLTEADRWILSRLAQCAQDVTRSIQTYRLNEAVSRLYDFFWHDLCDWYIELCKPRIQEQQTQAVLLTVLDSALRLLHPVMPFITSEIYTRLYPKEKSRIPFVSQSWPRIPAAWKNLKVEREMSELIDHIQAIRNIRSVWKIDPQKKLSIFFKAKNRAAADWIRRQEPEISRLARIEHMQIEIKAARPPQSATGHIGKMAQSFVYLKGVIDVDKEIERLRQALAEIERVSKDLAARLENPGFLAKAPEHVVKSEKARLAEFAEKKGKLEDNIRVLTPGSTSTC